MSDIASDTHCGALPGGNGNWTPGKLETLEDVHDEST